MHLSYRYFFEPAIVVAPFGLAVFAGRTPSVGGLLLAHFIRRLYAAVDAFASMSIPTVPS